MSLMLSALLHKRYMPASPSIKNNGYWVGCDIRKHTNICCCDLLREEKIMLRCITSFNGNTVISQSLFNQHLLNITKVFCKSVMETRLLFC